MHRPSHRRNLSLNQVGNKSDQRLSGGRPPGPDRACVDTSAPADRSLCGDGRLGRPAKRSEASAVPETCTQACHSGRGRSECDGGAEEPAVSFFSRRQNPTPQSAGSQGESPLSTPAGSSAINRSNSARVRVIKAAANCRADCCRSADRSFTRMFSKATSSSNQRKVFCTRWMR